MSHDASEDDRDFDRWLQQARWPVGDADQLPRLEAHWRELRQAAIVVPAERERRRRGFAMGALAASLLLLAGVGGWLASRSTPVVSPVIELVNSTSAPAQQTVAGPIVTSTAPVFVRDPTPYEQAVLAVAIARQKAKQVAVAGVPVLGKPLMPVQRRAKSQAQATLVALVTDLAANDKVDVSERMANMRESRPRLEQRVWQLIEQGDTTQRLGAVRLLAELGTQRSVPLLERLTGEPELHEAALLVLAPLVNDRQLAWLADREPETKLRSVLLGQLLERRTPESAGWFLRFVDQPRTRAVALDIVASLENPPIDLLFSFLESSQTAQRLAAAQALAHCRDPLIAERLCTTAIKGVARHEALIALLLHSSPQAAHCLEEARRDLYLVASVQAAEQQLHSLTPAPGGNLP